MNECLDEAAEECDAFRADFTIDLETDGQHTLSTRVLEITDGTLRIDYDNDGVFEVEPYKADEQFLRSVYGPLERTDASVPYCYYTQRGNAADAMLQLITYPKSDTARTNGIKFWAKVVPTHLTATSDNVPVHLNEEKFLIPGLCVGLAQAEAARGRQDAPIEYWFGEWERAKLAWAEYVENMLRGTFREIRYIPAPGDYEW